MKPDHYIAFDWPKFQADTHGLRREHKWSYWTAICTYYWAGCTGLPNDDDFLRRACECDLADWLLTKGAVFGRLFTLNEDGLWHQKRAKLEFERALKLMRVRSKSGKTGGNNRWNKGKHIANIQQGNSKTMATDEANCEVNGMAKECVCQVSSPTPTPTDVPTPTPSSVGYVCEPPPGCPRTEKEALDIASMIGVDKDTTLKVFNFLAGRGWRDKAGNTILSFSHYLKGQDLVAKDILARTTSTYLPEKEAKKKAMRAMIDREMERIDKI